MPKLLLATGNPGKIREFKQLFGDLPDLEILTADDVGGLPEVIEDGDTFEHNACKKAREIAAAKGMRVLSDDSGLEVDALGGRPGVRSARYAGVHCDDEDNNALLVKELREVPETERTARYRVVLALAEPEGPLQQQPHTEDGVCEGHIELTPRGDNGFGYDPYFRPEGHDCRMAELSPEEKNRISHRAVAARKMRDYLASR
ncbi:MAG: RdgB/HAM1 family non-canonical purine NTP pyrophosphatase [Myxococcales bacterium]|nr:RdgB/HAM1 family non-canonical purine NTP pyrophosphatase [Myxococcales bacterium]